MLSNNFNVSYPIALKNLVIKYPSGSQCEITSMYGDKYYSFDDSGEWNFVFPYVGKYTIQCVTAFGSIEKTIEIDDYTKPNETIEINERFTYTGNWKHDDLDSLDIYLFTSSGTLTLAEDSIVDICLVGGGNTGGKSNGAGGAGGKVVHQYGITLKANTPYSITIASAGGTTKAFDYSANNQGVAGGAGGGENGQGKNGKTGTYLFGNTNYKAYGASGAGAGMHGNDPQGGFYGGGYGGLWGSSERRNGGSATSYGGGGGAGSSENNVPGSGYQGALFIRKHQ